MQVQNTIPKGPEKKGHSRFAPSSAARWIACPGSVLLSEQIADRPRSTYADEGSVAHAVLDRCLRGGSTAEAFRGFWGSVAKSGDVMINQNEGDFLIDDEIVDSVDLALTEIRGYPGIDDAVCFAEQTVEIREVDGEVVFGRVDFLAHFPFDRLVVVDFKHGAGVPVEAKENPQLIAYALGALNMIEPDFDRVDLVIIQPRAPHSSGPVRVHTMTPEEVAKWGEQIDAAIGEATKPLGRIKPGPHCRFCPAASVCPALRLATKTLARVADGPPPEEVAKIAAVLDQAERVEAFISACREAAIGLLENGLPVPGWKLVAKRSRRVWADEGVTVRRLKSRGFKQTDYFDQKLKGLKEIEKLLGKETVDKLTTKPDAGTTLAAITDPRPEIESAARDFAGVDVALLDERR